MKCKLCGQVKDKGDTGNSDFDEIYCSTQCYVEGED